MNVRGEVVTIPTEAIIEVLPKLSKKQLIWYSLSLSYTIEMLLGEERTCSDDDIDKMNKAACEVKRILESAYEEYIRRN